MAAEANGDWCPSRSSKPVEGRKTFGGFDSRPPPQSNRASDLGLWWRAALRNETAIGARNRKDRSDRTSVSKFLGSAEISPHKCFGSPRRTGLRPPSSETGGENMARPRSTRMADATIADLREEFLDRCRAKNLSVRTLEWYEDRTQRFSEWCFDRGIRVMGKRQEGARSAARKDGFACSASLPECRRRTSGGRPLLHLLPRPTLAPVSDHGHGGRLRSRRGHHRRQVFAAHAPPHRREAVHPRRRRRLHPPEAARAYIACHGQAIRRAREHRCRGPTRALQSGRFTTAASIAPNLVSFDRRLVTICSERF